MKLHDFITNKEIELVANSIKNRMSFSIKKEVKGYEFRIKNGKAGVDFGDGTKKGDYIIHLGFQAKTRGNGRPISGDELKKLEDKDKLTKFLDDYMKNNRIEGYEGIDEGQIDLFNLTI